MVSFARPVNPAQAALIALMIYSTSTFATTPTPKTIALVAAVGDQFQHVRQKQSVGSNLEPYTRRQLRISDQSLNMAVLKGLDKAIGLEQPNANRILLALNVKDESTALPQEREAKTMQRLVKALEEMPARKDWDEIIAITPKWQFSGRQGMGSKLTGIGVYVQPLTKGNTGLLGDTVQATSATTAEDIERQEVKSDVYVAPFFYAQVTTFDAKTLRVLKQEAKYDYRKTVNTKSTALDVEKGFTPEEMAGVILDFVEAASANAVSQRENTGTVEVGPATAVQK
jgi:hypothetical protein